MSVDQIANTADIGRFVSLLKFPVELRIPKHPKYRVVSGYYDNAAALADACRHWSENNSPAVYVTLNPCKPDLLARSYNRVETWVKSSTADADITRRVWLPVDLDAVRLAGISSTDSEHAAALAVTAQITDGLSALGWPAPLVGDSGNGGHLLWRCDWPADDEHGGLAKRFLAHLAKLYDTPAVTVDPTVCNHSRIWKVYGTMVRKGDDVPALGRRHRLAKIVHCPDPLAAVTADMVRRLLDGPAASYSVPDSATTSSTPPSSTNSTATSSTADDGFGEVNLDELAADARPTSSTATSSTGGPYDMEAFVHRHGIDVVDVTPYKGGTKYTLATCPWADEHSSGQPDGAALFVTERGAAAFSCFHSHCKDREWRDVKRHYGEAASTASSTASTMNSSTASPPLSSTTTSSTASTVKRPVIVAVGRQLRDVTADALAAVRRANTPARYFSRGGTLVRLGDDDALAVRLDTDGVRNLLAGVADWVRVREGKDGPVAVPIFPPLDVVRDTAATRPDLPELRGVVAAPTYTAGGRLVTTPGYDAESGLYYRPPQGFTVPAVAERPTPGDVGAAVALLDDLIADFPFAGPADKANALAMFLLPFVRQLIAGPTPLHAVDAPTEGSGKSLLVEVAAVLWTGRRAVHVSEPHRGDDWPKVLLPSLMAGGPYLSIDNVSRPLSSSSLAAALTSTTYSDRILGESRMVEVPVGCVWVASGNNLEASREITRRMVRIRLDARCESPHRRTGWRHPDLIGWAMAHRGELVAACLTLARAWLAAGRPGGSASLGSYERWAATLGGILDVAGVGGFLQNLDETADAVNGDDAECRRLVRLWHATYGEEVVTAGGVVEMADAAGLALPDLDATGDRAKAAGHWLKRRTGRVWDGWRIERAADPRGKSNGYRLAAATPPGGPGVPASTPTSSTASTTCSSTPSTVSATTSTASSSTASPPPAASTATPSTVSASTSTASSSTIPTATSSPAPTTCSSPTTPPSTATPSTVSASTSTTASSTVPPATSSPPSTTSSSTASTATVGVVGLPGLRGTVLDRFYPSGVLRVRFVVPDDAVAALDGGVRGRLRRASPGVWFADADPADLLAV